jgi:hypothetical protein
LDRFLLYNRLKANIDAVDDLDLRKRLNGMISPLYLYAILCVENGLEEKFEELSLVEKLKALPGRISGRLSQFRTGRRMKNVRTLLNTKEVQADIIFYPVEPTHLRQMLPVSTQLPREAYFYITDRLNIYSQLTELGIKCLLIPITHDTSPNNFDYSMLGESIIPPELADKWVSFCRHQVETKYSSLEKSISQALNILRPSKCVIGYDITPEGRIAVDICHNLNIESVCIQHGSIAGEPLDGEHVVDSYSLYGMQAKEYLEGIGNKSASLKVFGAPYLDKELFESERDKATLKMLGLNEKRETLLVALSGPGHCTTMDHFNEIVGSLVLFAKNHPSINLIFKLHRKDSIQNYNRIFKELGYSCPLIDSQDQRFPTDIFYWLNNTDVLITGSSTVALEAMLKANPVITIDYQNQYQNIDFIEMGCTYHVDKKEQLEETVLKVLATRLSEEKDSVQINAKNYAERYFYSDEIPASKRIADLLMTDTIAAN